MLKLAYQTGVKLALDAESDALNEAAQRLYGIGGGLAGAAGGGFLGRYLGQQVAEALDLDEDVGGIIGAGLGALAGGGLGGIAGSNLSSVLGQRGEDPAAQEAAGAPATVPVSPLDQLSSGSTLGVSQPLYDVTPANTYYAPAEEALAPTDVYALGLTGSGYDDYGYDDYGYGYDDYGYGYGY